MLLEFDKFRDKMRGCWIGKNIGGVLGAPFECRRGLFDVTFYTQDLSNGPPPNDDLDLQIIWLAAVERYGRNVNSSILGEYWLTFVMPNWVEYGMGKNNMRAGLVPPLSGVVDNNYKDSCGCFIRSEIWACLAPGHPQIAARYAYEDASVDHAHEGLYGEVFFAALQSAAFVESNRDKLVEIGLTYIPDDCAVAQTVKEAQRCYKKGVSFEDARINIHATAPGCFGVQFMKVQDIKDDGFEDIGQPGFDAPENIGFAIAAWYYGEDDFGKSLCLAVNCGEDTDCSAASLGALMGIICGAEALPEKWTAPLDDRIETLCIEKTAWGAIWIPSTATELADRVLRVVPSFLGTRLCDLFAPGGYTINTLSGDELLCPRSAEYLPLSGGGMVKNVPIYELTSSPYILRQEHPLFRVAVNYIDGPFFNTGVSKKLIVTVTDTGYMMQQQWVSFRLWTPEGVTVTGGREFCVPMNYNHGSKAETTFELMDTEAFTGGKMEMILDISLVGRHSSSPIKIVLMRR